MPLGNGDWYVLMNEKLAKKLDIQIGDNVTLEIEKDTSKYGMEIPEELEELLQQDPEGEQHFHSLTPGKQRNLIYIVGNVKNSNSRLNKALAIMHHLKEFEGKLDFKILNQTIKEFNNR